MNIQYELPTHVFFKLFYFHMNSRLKALWVKVSRDKKNMVCPIILCCRNVGYTCVEKGNGAEEKDRG